MIICLQFKMGNCCASKQVEIPSHKTNMIRKPPPIQQTIGPQQFTGESKKDSILSVNISPSGVNVSRPSMTADIQHELTPPPMKPSEFSNQKQLNQKEETKTQLQSPIGKQVKGRVKEKKFFDLRFPPTFQKSKIYKITTTFPVTKPYSTQKDFSNVLEKYRDTQNTKVDQKFVAPDFDKLSDQILEIKNRNWIQDLINAHQQYMKSFKHSGFDCLVKQKQLIQLREQFNWLVWAVAHQYFKSWNTKPSLPKQDSHKWSEGFAFKGIYIKLLPIEESNHIVEEMKGLAQIQIELNQLICQQETGRLATQLITPLLTIVKCGAFLIYGTPQIYTQEIQEQKQDIAQRILTTEAQQVSIEQKESLQYQLPRVSSITAVSANQDINNLLPSHRQTFNYLHQNLDKNLEFMQELKQLQKMPTIKNLSANNLIPVLDFEKLKNNESNQADVEISYLIGHIKSCFQTLSSESTQSSMFIIPTVSTQDIKFQPFPQSKLIEYSELKNYLCHEDSYESAAGNMKPKGDIQSSPQNSPNASRTETNRTIQEEDFQKQIMTKHGWSIMMIQMSSGNFGRITENRRATHLHNLSKSLHATKTINQSSPPPKFVQSAFTVKKQNENIQLQSPITTNGKSPAILMQQRDLVFNQDDSSIFGTCFVNAQFERSLKILPFFSQNSYPVGIEQLFNESLNHCANLLNGNPEQISNERSMKELLHRHGLNMRFLWLLLPKLNLKRSRDLVMICIVLRIMKKVVSSKVVTKCRNETSNIVMPSVPAEKRISYNAANMDSMKESLAMFMNAVLKNKFAKYKSTFDETLLGLFLHRLKAIPLAVSLEIDQTELNYLESRDILDQVLDCPSHAATTFLNSVQTYFNVTFTPEFCRCYRQDIFSLLNKSQPVTVSDFKSINLQVETMLTLREQAYFLLAHKLSPDRNKQQEKNTQDNLQRVFNKSVDRSIRIDTDNDTSRQKPTFYQSAKRQDTHRNFKNLPSNISQSFTLIDLSKKNVQAKGELQFPSKLYRQNPSSIPFCLLQSQYDLPSVDVLNEWVFLLEILQKDCFSICFDNSDQVLVEAYSLQALSTHLLTDDSESVFKLLDKIRFQLNSAISISPEIITVAMLLNALWSDKNEEISLEEAEKLYVFSMESLFGLNGDPRGRGNSGLPIMMLIAWKLQLLSLVGKKMQDSELAEEIFDACLNNCINHKKQFKNQVEQVVLAQQKAYRESEISQVRMSNSYKRTKINFEQHQEINKLYFDIKRYRSRPRNVLTAGGFVKSSAKHTQSIQGDMDKQLTQRLNSMQKQKLHPSEISHLQKQNFDAELSDIEIELKENANESYVSNRFMHLEEEKQLPFPHWMINRQIYQQQAQSIKKEKERDQKEMMNQLIRQSLNQIESQSLMSWLVTYLPTQFFSGVQWDSQTFKEMCFGQTSKLMSQTGSSKSDVQSNKSGNSFRNNVPESPSSRNRKPMGSYSQIFGKVGGIQKQEIQGQLYMWGTDSQGQLGLDHFCPQQKQGILQNQALKILHPRLCISLKDEVIKEICCGYSFTLAINMYGQLYSWGANECGQLGLGPFSMSQTIFRTPQMNPYLTSVSKLSAGNEHCLALTRQGELFVWGSANLTGLNDQEHRSTPAIIEMFQENRALQISCGGLHSMVLTKQGEVYTWGSNEGGQLGLDNKLFIKADCVTKPTLVEALSRKGVFVTQIACGETHSVVLTKDHKVYGWGMSMYGQLGLGFSADSFEPGVGLAKSKVLTPTEISPYLPPQVKIVQIFCGAAFTLLKTQEGELYGCGINDLGQLGLDTYVEDMQLALLDRTKLKGGNFGQQMSSDVTVPSKVICFEKMNVQSVACGENHSLAVIGEEKNMLWAWGIYKNGQLGLGEVTMKMNPRPVQNLCSSQIHSIAAGSMHSAALLGDQQQLSQFSHSFFLNTDLLYNPWIIDIRQILTKTRNDTYMSPRIVQNQQNL